MSILCVWLPVVVLSMYLQSLHGLEERMLTSSLGLDTDNYQALTVSLTGFN